MSETKKKRSLDETKEYITLILVDEEQPFQVFRADASAVSISAIRDKAQEACNAEEHLEFKDFWVAFAYYIRVGTSDDDQYHPELDAVKRAVSSRSDWECVNKDKWAPFHMDWKSSETFVLNTWG